MEGESMSEWKEVRLGDITDIIGDGIHGTPVYDENGEYYFINGSNLYKGKIIINNDTKKIGYEEYLKHKKVLNKNTILLSINGTIGNIALYNGEKCILGKSACYININHLFDKFFIFYILSSHKFLKEITFKANGTTIKNVSLKQIRDYTFYIPSSYEKQKEIAGILSSLDAKIETNNKLNEKLEEMAQAIFRSWFVDFEPFKDKPFHETELGMIPEGWNVCCLGDITKQTKEKVGSNRFLKVLSPINTGELTLSEDFFTKQVYSKDISKYILVRKNNFAYNPARVNIGSLGRNEYDFDGCVSPVYVVFEVIKEYENFFDLFRRQKTFINSVISLAIGGVRQSLSYNDFSYIKLVVPPKNVIEKFNDIYSELDKLIKTKKIENERLASLRDTLLPRLMSGELIV